MMIYPITRNIPWSVVPQAVGLRPLIAESPNFEIMLDVNASLTTTMNMINKASINLKFTVRGFVFFGSLSTSLANALSDVESVLRDVLIAL